MCQPGFFPALGRSLLCTCSALALWAASSAGVLAQKNFDQPPQLGGTTPSAPSPAPSPAPAPAPAAPRPAARAPSTTNTRFTLINNSDMVIDTLNISPVSETEWGDDLLGTLSLPAHSRLIAGPAQDTGCMFDVRVAYHDRREEILRRQNLCDIQELTFTGRNARRVQRRSNTD